MADYTETRKRVAETIETLESGLARLTDPEEREEFALLVLEEFAS